jgi:hypothetical protein
MVSRGEGRPFKSQKILARVGKATRIQAARNT